MDFRDDNQLVILGETNFRNQRWRFGIKQDDRRRHMYIVGATGMGKTEFMKNMAIQDIEAGRGVAFVDPHGDPSRDLLDFIPPERAGDVIYFDPGDLMFPVAFNVMEKVDFELRHLVASGLLGVFKKIWPDVWSSRMEYILNNAILALLEYPNSTLLDINRMMSSKDYRNQVVANIKDPIVKGFWIEEFAKYADKFATEATAAIQNKIGQFTSNNLIRNIIGQPHSTIDMRDIMDNGKIFIANLSRGRIGEDASRLLGALLITKIQLAAMSRVDVLERDRRDFYLTVDEFQHFATESFANILSEARKFHLCLTVGHQYIKQMEEVVRDAVFGNVGTIITFRVGAEDAEFLEKWFFPDFVMNDIVNLGKYNIYLKLMIDGIMSKGFSASTLPPIPIPETARAQEIINRTRQTYATPREKVEKDIALWAGFTEDGSTIAQADLRSMLKDILKGPPPRGDVGVNPLPQEVSRAKEPPSPVALDQPPRDTRPPTETLDRESLVDTRFDPDTQSSAGPGDTFHVSPTPDQGPAEVHPSSPSVSPTVTARIPSPPGLSLDQALHSKPVDFQGRPLGERPGGRSRRRRGKRSGGGSRPASGPVPSHQNQSPNQSPSAPTGELKSLLTSILTEDEEG